MFIYTAKISKKKVVVFLLVLAFILCAIIVYAGMRDRARREAFSKAAETDERRAEYLRSFGWEIDPAPVEEQQIVIPKEFPSVYNEYNKLQMEQGFDLTDYAGLDAVRYTYTVKNYPGYDGGVYADLILYQGRVIAGDIRSAALDGFMHGLSMP